MVMWAEGKALFSGSICRQALQRPADSLYRGLKSSSMLSRFSRVWLFGTPWTVTHQAPLCMGFLWQEYWSGLSFPSPGDLPRPRDWTCVSCLPCIAGDSLPLSQSSRESPVLILQSVTILIETSMWFFLFSVFWKQPFWSDFPSSSTGFVSIYFLFYSATKISVWLVLSWLDLSDTTHEPSWYRFLWFSDYTTCTQSSCKLQQ